MGYQESIIKINNQEKFDEVVSYLKLKEKDLNLFINILSVVTFKNNVKLSYGFMRNVSFKPGEKAILIGGERFANNNHTLFKDNHKLSKYSNPIPIEDFLIVNANKEDNTQLESKKPSASIFNPEFGPKLRQWFTDNLSEINFKDYMEINLNRGGNMEKLIMKEFKCELEIEKWVHGETMKNLKEETEIKEEIIRHRKAVKNIVDLYETRKACLEHPEGLEKSLER